MAVTIGYIFILGLMYFPYFRTLLLKVTEPIGAKYDGANASIKVLENCKVGDVFLLYKIKEHFSAAGFYNLLCKLSDPQRVERMIEGPREDSLPTNPNPQQAMNQKRQLAQNMNMMQAAMAANRGNGLPMNMRMK